MFSTQGKLKLGMYSSTDKNDDFYKKKKVFVRWFMQPNSY